MLTHPEKRETLTLKTPINLVAPKSSSLFEKLFGHTVLDALAHFPTGIIEKTHCTSLRPDLVGKTILLDIEPVQHIPPLQKGRGAYRIIGNVLPSKDVLELVFFYKKANTKFLAFSFAVGRPKYIVGKLEKFGDTYRITHPSGARKSRDHFLDSSLGAQKEIVYPKIAGLANQRIQDFINYLLQNLSAPPEWQASHYEYPSFLKALEIVHHPTNIQEILTPTSKAYRRLLHDELLAQQIALILARQQTKTLRGVVISPQSQLQHTLRSTLPFHLTQGQEDALKMIEKDMASGEPMLRLVQGDVGCGKTIVAALAMANALERGYQAAVLAPTDILSTQHFETFSRLFEGTGYHVELLTGKITGKKRKIILEKLEQGAIHILIGTHALIQDHVHFKNLALVVVDEQHRFGVQQRAALTQKGKAPHLLSMTATPIPRTLQMALYGDLDVTSILEKPKGRKDIATTLHSVTKIHEIVAHLQNVLSPQNKAYWVCPLIEEDEASAYTAVKERFSHLQNHFGERVTLLHGKMRASEKEAAMEAFKNGSVDLIISTTVIEVGVDVKTANIMIIEHAERFGLAQLHQLRGRVGRSDAQAHCLLLFDKLSPIGRERLQAMRESNDGFYLAEMDLKIRGSGDVFGLVQSGAMPFLFYKGGQPRFFQEILSLAHKDALDITQKDPTLVSPQGEGMRVLLRVFDRENSLNVLRAG